MGAEMLRFNVLILVVLAFPLLAWAECTDCPGSGKDHSRCSCSEFHRYRGNAELNSFHVVIKAESSCATGFTLLFRDERGRRAREIALNGPHAGEQSYDVLIENPIPAMAIRQAVLINNTSNDVKITYMKITGGLSDGDFVFFEKECPGVVIGPKGCPRMVLYEGTK
jgi:hypothetical protein